MSTHKNLSQTSNEMDFLEQMNCASGKLRNQQKAALQDLARKVLNARERSFSCNRELWKMLFIHVRE